jgi:aryl-alcohol dehydrogenase-like predicted oxidoreductase
VRERAIPGTGRPVSELGFPLDWAGPPILGPGASKWPALLRRARAAGVTLFDLSARRTTEAAEVLFREAFPQPEASVTVLEPYPAIEPGSGAVGREPNPARREASEPPADPRTCAHAIRERLRLPPAAGLVLLVDDIGRGRDGAAAGRALSDGAGSGSYDAWGVRLEAGRPTLDRAERSVASGARVLSAPYDLLRREPGDSLLRRIAGTDVTFLARDPHGAGELDGSLVRTPFGAVPGPSGPMRWSEIRDRFAPIVELGFLTRDRRRTLGQAALQFCLLSDRVLAVEPRMDDPTRIDEFVRYDTVAPLSEDERSRLDALGALR